MPKGHLPVRSYLGPVLSRSPRIGGRSSGIASPGYSPSVRTADPRLRFASGDRDRQRAPLWGPSAAEERARLLEVEREARAQVERVSLMKDEPWQPFRTSCARR
jgi:hypothetical protein